MHTNNRRDIPLNKIGFIDDDDDMLPCPFSKCNFYAREKYIHVRHCTCTCFYTNEGNVKAHTQKKM